MDGLLQKNGVRYTTLLSVNKCLVIKKCGTSHFTNIKKDPDDISGSF